MNVTQEDNSILAKCKSCPQSFKITDSEVAFYTAKGFPLPKRCKPCRQLRRDAKNNDLPKPFANKLTGFRMDDKQDKRDRPRNSS